jgi:hypothetical protein
MKRLSNILFAAALFTGVAFFSPLSVWAGSCCGGGSGVTLLLPAFYKGMVDVSLDLEKYDGFWNQDGRYTADPPGSHIWQYRLNAGYALRLAPRWQTSIIVPYVWNENKYSGLSSRSEGLGDTTLNLWYDAVYDKTPWKIQDFKDLMPSVTIGTALLVPTGISPYDSVNSSFEVTGRGFYRIDGNVLIAKIFHPWSASVALSYGTYLERSVNEEYGKYVEPYRKKLGDRTSASVSLSYIYYFGSAGDALTGTGSFSYLREEDAAINGNRQSLSGFEKNAFGGAIAYSSTDHDWSIRGSWSHAIQRHDWGYNFPTTDIYTAGVSYGFR